MRENDTVHADVLNYFTAEFDALEERLRGGMLEDYRERVLVSQKIGEAVHLLAPYVRSDARARRLVRHAEALKQELLSVREIIVKQIMKHKEHPSLLQALMERNGLLPRATQSGKDDTAPSPTASDLEA
ncbi:hypothetical protein LPW11_07365 [Geomonas sp. RF6]|uniref:hypothetical protein n=1 Tax=Geomonas sp. RF6 TaxID=2897342 RepID=UPI001E4E3E62|nr:hypothetical protein [Geomonas sp. RF6]UFS72001.1 hypothetical protein LPW11_07365 [Geomonas sp. RF6]